jgi:hypothetical protein
MSAIARSFWRQMVQLLPPDPAPVHVTRVQGRGGRAILGAGEMSILRLQEISTARRFC